MKHSKGLNGDLKPEHKKITDGTTVGRPQEATKVISLVKMAKNLPSVSRN